MQRAPGEFSIATPFVVLLASIVSFGCVERHRVTASHSHQPRRNTGPCIQVRAEGNVPTIDDFESDVRRIRSHEGRGGWWFSYNDGSGGRLVKEVVSTGAQTGRALHVTSEGFGKWGAGFGFNLRPDATQSHACAYDASAYEGIRFRARGHGRVRLAIGEPSNIPPSLGGACTRAKNLCYDEPGAWVTLSAEWRTFEFPFCTLFPEGWGGSHDGLNPSQIVGVQFRTEAHEPLELWLDELAFYRGKPGEPKPRCGPTCPLDSVPSTAKINPSALMGPSVPALGVHTFEQPTTSCGSLTRRYLSYVPSRLPRRATVPVLIMLHGSGGNAESSRTFHARNRFDALAERDGFIVIYGNAAPGAHTSPDPNFPNTGVWREAIFEDGEVDDVEYLKLLVEDLKKRDVIAGGNSLLLAGISNGGGMVLEAARRMPDTYAGLAAFMPYDGEQPKPVPAVNIRRLLFAYGIDDPGMSAGYHSILAPQPALWAAAMGLPVSATEAPLRSVLPNLVFEGSGYQGKSAIALATRNSQVTEFDMTGANALILVRVLVFDHAGHFWPNPVQDTADWVLNRWGFRNQDFDAADMTWEFLKPAAEALNR